MPDARMPGILHANRETVKEVNPKLLNPLAIGVTLGGQFLEVVAPRPKLRSGYTYEFSLLSKRAVTRTVPGAADAQGFVGLSVAVGGRI